MSPFLAGVTWLLVFQCLGEALVRLGNAPLPGPVVGMALLAVALIVRSRGGAPLPASLTAASDGLARHLSLLFVPAGVGVMLYVGQIAQEWLPIVVSLAVSTVLAIGVAALVFQRLAGREAPAEGEAREAP